MKYSPETCAINAKNWPWPRLITHRGGGDYAPENTMAAFRAGVKFGFDMMEYDVKLSKDAIEILLHDDDIKRTSNGQGNAADLTLKELLRYDFGSWHSPAYAGESITTLRAIAHYTQHYKLHSNIEIKPSRGMDGITGKAIAQTAQKLWQAITIPPLLSSFSTNALQSALDAAPGLPRALLIEEELPHDWEYQLAQLRCIGLNLNTSIVTKALAGEILRKGYTLIVWTVNERARAQELLDWGCHGIITDAITTINPNTLKRFIRP